MRPALRFLLVKVSGNARIQQCLHRGATAAQFLMGIGAGGSADSSGEHAIIEKLGRWGATRRPLCIFDVGANQGQFLRLLWQGLQRTSFHIHAFEPGQEAYRSLCESASTYSNITLNNFALGRVPGSAELYYDKPGSGLASLSRRRMHHHGFEFGRSETVAIDTLDQYCARHAVEGIDLLKLDVEGHELDVLRGGLDLFRKRKIRMVSFEFGGCNIDSRTFFQDFYYFFHDCGMKAIFRITPSGYLAPIAQYDESVEQFRTTNFLVLSDG